jgi:putative transposase
MDRRHLREGAPEWAHRLGCGIIAVEVNSDRRREVLGMDIGPSEAETFWTEFLRKLARRGLARRQVSQLRLPMKGSKAAVSKVLNAMWQRCRVHFMRNALAYAGMSGRRVVSAFIATAFAEDDAEAARAQWRRIADHLPPKLPKLAVFLDTFSPLKSYPPKHELVLRGPILDQINAGSISNDRNDQDVLESIA